MAALPLSVFISYSHKDEELKEELEVHLSTLIRQEKIAPWQDRTLEAGTKWDPEIKAALEKADIILLLITPRFMASNYINDVELKRALERDQEGTVRVIPIILKPVDTQGTEIAAFQALPKDAKPVVKWDDQDEAFLDVVKGIRRVIDSLTASNAGGHGGESGATSAAPSTTGGAISPPPAQPSGVGRSPMELINALARLPGPQFSQLLFVVDPPSGLIPTSAAQLDQAKALLTWARNDPSHNLGEIEAVLDEILGNR